MFDTSSTLITITNPVYVTADLSCINCLLSVNGGPAFPFAANKHDTELHGTAIYAALVNGDHGPIGPYTAPPPQT